MANKCGAFLQSCPDAPVLPVENISNWTGSDLPGAQGKTVGQRSEREMDEVWSKKHAGRREAVGSNGNLMRGEKELMFRDQ